MPPSTRGDAPVVAFAGSLAGNSRNPNRDAERLVRTEAAFHRRQMAIETRRHVVPGIAWTDQRRTIVATKISAQLHPLLLGMPTRSVANGDGGRIHLLAGD